MLKLTPVLYTTDCRGIRRLWRHIWRGSWEMWRIVWRRGDNFFLKIAWRHLWRPLTLTLTSTLSLNLNLTRTAACGNYFSVRQIFHYTGVARANKMRAACLIAVLTTSTVRPAFAFLDDTYVGLRTPDRRFHRRPTGKYLCSALLLC